MPGRHVAAPAWLAAGPVRHGARQGARFAAWGAIAAAVVAGSALSAIPEQASPSAEAAPPSDPLGLPSDAEAVNTQSAQLQASVVRVLGTSGGAGESAGSAEGGSGAAGGQGSGGGPGWHRDARASGCCRAREGTRPVVRGGPSRRGRELIRPGERRRSAERGQGRADQACTGQAGTGQARSRHTRPEQAGSGQARAREAG